MDSGNFEQEYCALRESAGLVDLSDRGVIAVTGVDRVRWLQGMVTNDVAGMSPRDSLYCFFLNAHGHIQADAYLLAEPERILVNCEPSATARLMPWLDHYIIMDQVEIADLTGELATFAVEGPRAAAAVDDYHPRLRTPRGFLLPVRRGESPAFQAQRAGWQAYETVRIESCIPRFGVDIEETTLPQETGQERALHYNKGCYIGQETVERIHSRGHVNWTLVGLKSSSPLAPGSKVESGGRVTSSAYSPAFGCHVALAYVRRESAAPGTRVTVEHQTAEVFTPGSPPA